MYAYLTIHITSPHTVRLVLELLGRVLIEVLEQRGLEQIGVDGSDAIDDMRADDAEEAHVYALLALLLHQRHASDARPVARELGLDRGQVARVHLVVVVEVALAVAHG